MDIQRLLTEIEMDVQELKFLFNAFSKNPDEVGRRMMKRDVERVQERLADLWKEVESLPMHRPVGPVGEKMVTPATEVKVIDIRPITKETMSFVSASQVEKVIPVTFLQNNIEEEVLIVKEVIQQEAVEKSEVNHTAILAERIRPAADLKRSISLNDSFRFSRELFEGSTERMNIILQRISELSSLNEALALLSEEVRVEEGNEALIDLQEFLKKFFN